MVQKEVGQRICAKSKMSLLSVAVQFYSKPEIISYVSKKSFYPQPKVDSAIIKITPKPIPKINTKKFFNLVKKGFSSKRKMLKNNLRINESILEELRLNPKIRAENLSIQDWLKLFHKLD
jgi:16S rRNA (adenine1518-N6/adenine1519-N6)-dimethyltransferase